jgi:hypothetical protein
MIIYIMYRILDYVIFIPLIIHYSIRTRICYQILSKKMFFLNITEGNSYKIQHPTPPPHCAKNKPHYF